jgi:hypothetical protein
VPKSGGIPKPPPIPKPAPDAAGPDKGPDQAPPDGGKGPDKAPPGGPDKTPPAGGKGPDKAPPDGGKGPDKAPPGGGRRERGDEYYGDPRPWYERWLGNAFAAKIYELKAENAKGPVIRGEANLHAQQATTREWENKLRQQQGKRGFGIMAAYYKTRLDWSRNAERGYEREMREYHGYMRNAEENLKRVLRTYEREYDEKLRPFEHEVKRERERLTALREVGGNLHESLALAREELMKLEDEADRRGFRRTPDWSRAESAVRRTIADIGDRIGRNELEIADRNARLVRADREADEWRKKKADLTERGRSHEFAFDLPNPVESQAERPGSMPEYSVTGQGPVFEAGTAPEGKEPGPKRPMAERFIYKWNQEHQAIRGEQVDDKAFLEQLAGHLKARDEQDIAKATPAEIGLVLKRMAEERGVIRADSWWDQKIAESLKAVQPKKQSA